MSILLQLFWWSMDFNIDRIEGDFAVIEWSNQRYSVLPTTMFAIPPEEQESYRFTIRRKLVGKWLLSKNDPIVITNDNGTVIIPAENNWKLNTHVGWELKRISHPPAVETNALLPD